jgi:hypothetical protein
VVRDRSWIAIAIALATVGVVLLLLVILGGVSLYQHHQNGQAARDEERTLLDVLRRIPQVIVISGTARHDVSNAVGGSSDCQVEATVEVETTLTPDRLFALLNQKGGPLYESPTAVRPGVLRVRGVDPAGSDILDWSCWAH